MKKTTAEWVRKAEDDHLIAKQSSQSKKPLHDGVCFHCQQCAEKYLKALLEELGISIQKTHDCEHLLSVLLPHHSSLKSLRRGLAFLTNFAVAVRYPGERASKRQAQAALRWAERVRMAARSILGI
jgi:HEPN domain-containing protein